MLEFKHYVNFDDDNDESLDTLMKNWKGPKPTKVILRVREDKTINIVEKYKDLQFLKYQFIRDGV